MRPSARSAFRRVFLSVGHVCIVVKIVFCIVCKVPIKGISLKSLRVYTELDGFAMVCRTHVGSLDRVWGGKAPHCLCRIIYI